MSQKNLEDELNEAFKKFQQEARDKSQAQGKKEVTQEEYHSQLITQLQDIYFEWRNSSFPNTQDYSTNRKRIKEFRENYATLRDKLKNVEYPLDVIRRFHAVNKRDDLDYVLLMCAVCDASKPWKILQSLKIELQPFFESKSLLPQLLYLAEHVRNAEVRFKDLDTVILTSCKMYGELDDFDGGNLIIDCNLSPLSKIGYRMKGGKITINRKVIGGYFAEGMQGGTLIFDGGVENVDVGTEMREGQIIINSDINGRKSGTLQSDYNIGHKMTGGKIMVNGNCTCDELSNIGWDMRGGKIQVKGKIKGGQFLGAYMSGGLIELYKEVEGEDIDLGSYMSGNSQIIINSNVLVNGIGAGMKGGRIEISGNVGADIGRSMKNGLISIYGNASPYYNLLKEYVCSMVGTWMEGGEIYIGGNVDHAGHEMKDGTIRINGNLSNKSNFVQYGGQIYEKEVLVEPSLRWKLLSSLAQKYGESVIHKARTKFGSIFHM